MATISEKLTQLNTNLGTINTEVGSQADLIAQIKGVLANAGAVVGSDSSATPTLYGSHVLKTGFFDVGEDGTYDVSDLGLLTYFYRSEDDGSCSRELIGAIEIANGKIIINSMVSNLTKTYDKFEEYWRDGFGYDDDAGTPELLIIEIPIPVEVSQDFYDRFMGMVDNDAGRSPYDIGVDSMLRDFVDWELYASEDGCSLYVANSHPSLYLHMEFSVWNYHKNVDDGISGAVTVAPNSDYYWDASEDGLLGQSSGDDWEIIISEMRFSRDEI